MTKKDSPRIETLLAEIALAIIPIAIEEGRRWLENHRRGGPTASPRKTPKVKAV